MSHVDPVNLVEVSQVKVRQRGRAIDPGRMHDNVEVPEALPPDLRRTPSGQAVRVAWLGARERP